MNIKEQMILFLQGYLDFANNKSNPYNFSSKVGLCGALDIFYIKEVATIQYLPFMQMFHERLRELNVANDDYPFGYKNYRSRYINSDQHKCPLRITFVKQYLNELKELNE